MPTLNETQHAEGFLVSEANGTRSRKEITVAAGSGSDRVLTAGMVLGQVTASSEYVQLAPGASDGSENFAGVLRHDTTAPDGSTVKSTAFVRDCEVNGDEIVWPAGITAPQQAAATTQAETAGVVLL